VRLLLERQLVVKMESDYLINSFLSNKSPNLNLSFLIFKMESGWSKA
jgi:hypothetical protein